MVNRIVVNIIHQLLKIMFIIYMQSPEWRFEQTSGSMKFVIIGFGVSIKKITKLLCWIVFFLFGVNNLYLSFFGFYKTNLFSRKYSNQNWKVIFHQYPCESFCYRSKISVH